MSDDQNNQDLRKQNAEYQRQLRNRTISIQQQQPIPESQQPTMSQPTQGPTGGSSTSDVDMDDAGRGTTRPNSGGNSPLPTRARTEATFTIFGTTYQARKEYTPDPSLVDLFAKLEKDLGENLDGKVLETMHDELAAIIEGIAYEGLNVKKMRLDLLKRSNDAEPTQPSKAIYIAILIYLTRGANVVSMKAKMKTDWRTLVDKIVSIFDVQSRVMARSDAVTFPRIAICFPQVTAFVARKYKPIGVVPDVLETYPHVMRNVSFPGLIPRTAGNPNELAVIEHLKEAHTFYQVRCSKVYNPNMKVTRQTFERQRNFTTTAIAQSDVPDERRWALIRMGSDILKDGILNSSIVEMAAKLRAAENPQPSTYL